MRLKMSKSQAEAVAVLMLCLLDAKPQNSEERMLYYLMQRIYKKLRNRLETSRSKDYSITLNDVEANFWASYWQLIRADVKDWTYERNIIDEQVRQIDQHYA